MHHCTIGILKKDSIQIQKGASSARSDDTKTLKGAVLDWITPNDRALVPALSRNLKTNRGFHHEVTGGLLCPAGLNWADEACVILCSTCAASSHVLAIRTKAGLRSGETMVAGDEWPIFLYYDGVYDPERPWDGLFRNAILISVSTFSLRRLQQVMLRYLSIGIQTYLHVAKLRRKGVQSNSRWQRADSWNDKSDTCFSRLYCYPGEITTALHLSFT
jgi:hypothetical protein